MKLSQLRNMKMNNGKRVITVFGLRQAKTCLRSRAKCTSLDSFHTCAKSHPGICSPLIHSVVYNISCLRTPKTLITARLSRLIFRCPHKPEDTFLHVSARLELGQLNSFQYFLI